MNIADSLKQFATDVFPNTTGVVVSQPVAALTTVFKPVKRTKLWELKEVHHCAIIGTCLPMDELVKFARRFAFKASLCDEFEMHVEAVDWAATRNEVSKAMQKYLDKKYQTYITCFELAKTDADVLALWQEHYARSEGAGAMWVALTHRAVSSKTQQVIYADMHMFSHQVGACQAADMRRLSHLEKENVAIRTTMEHQQRLQARTEDKLRQQLHKATAELEDLRQSVNQVAALQARLAAFESGEAIQEMERRLANLMSTDEQMRIAAERSCTLEKALKAAHTKITALVRERDELATEQNALECLLLASNSDDEACDNQRSSCEHVLQGRCVLCVGGRTALVPQYRMLAGRLGIRLIHHDGGQQEALSRLPDMINSADAVICPTDCISHSAYYQLKRHSKRTGKPCLLFKGASVSGFAVALAQLSSGRISLNGKHIPASQEMADK